MEQPRCRVPWAGRSAARTCRIREGSRAEPERRRGERKSFASQQGRGFHACRPAGRFKSTKARGRPARRVEAQAKQPDINLLAPDQGGQLLAAPNETWAKAITGNDTDEVQVRPGEEAVYAFKDASRRHESPVGGFRSIGKFAAQNLRLIKSPYQEFTFPETTAKYFKIKVLSNYGGSPLGNTFLKQIRLSGRPAA